jgi:hypothetical protein
MLAEEKRALDLLTVLRDLLERRLTAPQEQSMVDKLVNALQAFLSDMYRIFLFPRFRLPPCLLPMCLRLPPGEVLLHRFTGTEIHSPRTVVCPFPLKIL